MHLSSYTLMLSTIDVHDIEKALVLDVGSVNINGTFRPIIEDRGWTYFGLDQYSADNVDLVADPYKYPFADNTFDFVISGSTMEHVPSIWLWVPELVRILKPLGTLVILTVWKCNQHRTPVDCWRIFPDGMSHLFDLTGQLTEYNISMPNDMDLYATAIKNPHPPPN